MLLWSATSSQILATAFTNPHRAMENTFQIPHRTLMRINSVVGKHTYIVSWKLWEGNPRDGVPAYLGFSGTLSHAAHQRAPSTEYWWHPLSHDLITPTEVLHVTLPQSSKATQQTILSRSPCAALPNIVSTCLLFAYERLSSALCRVFMVPNHIPVYFPNIPSQQRRSMFAEGW